MAKAIRAAHIVKHPAPKEGLRSALYYPHTQMKRMNLVKSSLLLWDQVEFIVPDEHYRPHYASRSVAEAIEFLGVMHQPDLAEKREAHQKIAELISDDLPASFRFTSKDPRELYEIYPQKFLPDTWQMLRHAKLAGAPVANSDYPLANHAGLGVMSILADCCAGQTKRRITDRGAAYASLVGTLADGPADELEQQDAEAEERLVGITLDVIDAPSISIKRLIEFRKQELKDPSHTLRAARHNYVDKIEAHLKKLAGHKRKGDRRELDRVFTESVRDDVAALRHGLKVRAKENFLKRETFTAVAVVATALGAVALGAPVVIPGAATIGGTIATFGGVVSAKNKYAKERLELIAKNPMAYLYEAKGGLRL